MEEKSDEETELEFAEDLDVTADIMPDEDSFVESRSSSLGS